MDNLHFNCMFIPVESVFVPQDHSGHPHNIILFEFRASCRVITKG